MIRELILVKLRMMRGMARSDEERFRLPLFTFMSLLFVVGLYYVGDTIVDFAMGVEPVGQLLVHKLLSITVLVFFSLLLFSNVVTAFSSFYLADDLEFLMGQPIPKDQLFTSRFLETLAISSWIIILFGLPLFISIGTGMGAPWYFYPVLLATLLPFVAIPTALASIVALLVTNIIAANRTRDAALFFGLVAFASLFVVIRSFEPERLLNPDSFDSIGEMMSLLSVPSTSFLPNDWVVNILTPMLFDLHAPVGWSAALLFSTPVALYFIAAWLHRPLYFRGYSNTQEGRHRGGLLAVARNWLLERSKHTGAKLETQLTELREKPGQESPLAQLVRKDQAVFTRDPSQWSQLLVVLAIVVIYLVNFKYFDAAADQTLIGDLGLVFFNLAACSFVVIALCGRFLFPAVSLEGRSFWLILQAPVSLERFLIGKWLGGLLPIIIIGQLLIWSSNLLVGIPLSLCLLTSVEILLITFLATAMAVGMGAVYPQFHNPNAARIASSFGAVIFMISTILISLLALAFWIRLSHYFENFASIPKIDPFTIKSAIAGALIALGPIPLILKIAARSLRRRF